MRRPHDPRLWMRRPHDHWRTRRPSNNRRQLYAGIIGGKTRYRRRLHHRRPRHHRRRGLHRWLRRLAAPAPAVCLHRRLRRRRCTGGGACTGRRGLDRWRRQWRWRLGGTCGAGATMARGRATIRSTSKTRRSTPAIPRRIPIRRPNKMMIGKRRRSSRMMKSMIRFRSGRRMTTMTRGLNPGHCVPMNTGRGATARRTGCACCPGCACCCCC